MAKRQKGIKQLIPKEEILTIEIVMAPNIFHAMASVYDLFVNEIPISDHQFEIMWKRIFGIMKHVKIARHINTKKFYMLVKKIVHETENRIWIDLVEPDNYEPTDGTIF